jgi:hypothetical protein
MARSSIPTTLRSFSDIYAMKSDLPPWALATGVPSRHVAHAALHVAAIVDGRGSRAVDAQESYWHHATGGTFAPSDLRLGERFLLDAGLLLNMDGTLILTVDLRELLAGTIEDAVIALCVRSLDVSRGADPDSGGQRDQLDRDLGELVPDAMRREELLLALGRRFSDTHQRAVGAIGEELVVAAARHELIILGRQDLARAVRRVSLLSDQLGYDVTAPRVAGPRRLLEVKATVIEPTSEDVLIHLSRNEADIGAATGDWSLVVCVVEDVEERRGRLLGWCPASAFADLLPTDGRTGRWEQAAIQLPVAGLVAGLPGPAA